MYEWVSEQKQRMMLKFWNNIYSNEWQEVLEIDDCSHPKWSWNIKENIAESDYLPCGKGSHSGHVTASEWRQFVGWWTPVSDLDSDQVIPNPLRHGEQRIQYSITCTWKLPSFTWPIFLQDMLQDPLASHPFTLIFYSYCIVFLCGTTATCIYIFCKKCLVVQWYIKSPRGPFMYAIHLLDLFSSVRCIKKFVYPEYINAYNMNKHELLFIF